ncbi:YjbF family lipoprotein [Salipiger aestuarii]|uniref:Group 4 capsule polysaccharide lipoprotein GfcB/YjbF n=1 Tax=Salipiger aestuarii TaxID=568098 RepID=A0A327YU84_9RHOB|nr:YjbF family lipoprotein [Salipiger aestuarii]EIE51165.1 lipoprotein [Citreicella sp. 357]KAA8616000.1 hypothetical protein AL037_01865 [Salipiger aestuarii]KAB2543390.1 hypothetical protein AL035_02750 [Salipiger aestuarii]RAK23936.1 group 4 capsule polysaccharide lipoprotein GfcB/YjbF [Salipiger aestuarii]
MKFPAFLLAATLALTACSSDSETSRAVDMLRGMLAAKRAGPQLALRDRLTPDMVAQTGTPLQIASFAQRAGAQILFAPETQNRGYVSWRSPTGESIVTLGGLLQATRGMGGDLMSADLADVQVAVSGQARRAERVHRYLDGENHIVAMAFVCDYARTPDQTTAYFRTLAVTRVTETCTGLNDRFENRYWLDGAGRIVRSVEWIGPAVGWVEREQLAR